MTLLLDNYRSKTCIKTCLINYFLIVRIKQTTELTIIGLLAGDIGDV